MKIISNCCSAQIIEETVCANCFEHCEPILEQSEPTWKEAITSAVITIAMCCLIGGILNG